MGKRKRANAPTGAAAAAAPEPAVTTKKAKKAPAPKEAQENGKKIKGPDAATSPATAVPLQEPVTIQIVTGSYDRILHGITTTVSLQPGNERAAFADTFLFNAHTSAIRCLALSPPSAPEAGRAQKVMLASGSSDERINVYNISAHPPSSSQTLLPPPQTTPASSSRDTKQKSKKKSNNGEPSNSSSMNEVLSTVAPRRILENRGNRELGTLLHHAASISRLAFPTRAKLLSASEDATVAVTRTRDWAPLSAIKAPVPNGSQGQNRPEGDTGTAPRGVADFAVHPSMKLMLTVGRGERCMRLWNLMTAKRAGVLNFGRDALRQVGEGSGRVGSGEGRRVLWSLPNRSGEDDEEEEEEEFCVAFDRDLLVFGMDSTPKCRVMPDHRTKVHEVAYVGLDANADAARSLLAVSTEDGRILFFSTRAADLTHPPTPPADSSNSGSGSGAHKRKGAEPSAPLPVAKLVAQLGGKAAGVVGRIKDFSVLRMPGYLVIPTGSSDGKVRVFAVALGELKQHDDGRQVGRLLGTYETSNRITCLEAFVMIPRPEGVEDSEDEDEEDFEGFSSSSGDEDDVEGQDDDDDDEDDE